MDFSNVMRNKKAYLSMDEIDMILKYCIDNNRYRDYMLIKTAARTGRRISEILGKPPYTHNTGLRPVDLFADGLWEWDILKKNHIKSKTKAGSKISEDKLKRKRLNKKPKRVLKPVDSDFDNEMKQYIQEHKISKFQRIFSISRQRADKILKEVAKGAGVQRPDMKIHMHMLRHSLAINLLKNNPNNPYILIQVNALLDHSDLNMTKTYAQFTPEDIKQSLNKLWG